MSDTPELPSEERERILKAAASAMPHANPLIWQDWWEGHAVHTEADDIVAIWKAAIAAAGASRAQTEWISVEKALPELNEQVLIASWAWGDPARGERIYGYATYLDSADATKCWVNDQDPDADSFWYAPTHWMRIAALPATLGDTK